MAAQFLEAADFLPGEAANGEDAVQPSLALHGKVALLVPEQGRGFHTPGEANLLQGVFHVQIIGVLHHLLALKHLSDAHFQGPVPLTFPAAHRNITQCLGRFQDLLLGLRGDADTLILIEYPRNGGYRDPGGSGDIF